MKAKTNYINKTIKAANLKIGDNIAPESYGIVNTGCVTVTNILSANNKITVFGSWYRYGKTIKSTVKNTPVFNANSSVLIREIYNK